VDRKRTKIRRLTIEARGDQAALICGSCGRAFLTIENGEMTFLSKHGSSQHENVLTEEHLKMIAVELQRQKPPFERW
jgi:hypothetical protein